MPHTLDFCADKRFKSSPPATRSTSLQDHWLVHVAVRLLGGQDNEEKPPAYEENPPAYAGPITLFISGNRDHLAKFITHCKTNKSTTLLVTTNKPTFTHATFANPEAADSVTAFLEEANFNLNTAPAKQSDNAPSTTLTIYMTTGEELSDLPAAGAVEGVITKRSGPSCTVNYPNIMDLYQSALRTEGGQP